jgi:hypothetical protein
VSLTTYRPEISDLLKHPNRFLKWRVELHKIAIKIMFLPCTSQKKYPYNSRHRTEEDPYQTIQIHDFSGLDFRSVKPILEAIGPVFEFLSHNFPETLGENIFVNFPWSFTIMGKHWLQKKFRA